MGDLTADFSRSEFACKCGCGFDTVDFALVTILQKGRDHLGRPIKINSGARCWKYHVELYEREGLGQPPENSQHLIGRAADVVVAGIDPGLVAEVLAQYGATGLKVYKHFTHADTRSGPKWGG